MFRKAPRLVIAGKPNGEEVGGGRIGRHMRGHCWFGKRQAWAMDLFTTALATRNRMSDHLLEWNARQRAPSAGIHGRTSRNGNWSNAQ